MARRAAGVLPWRTQTRRWLLWPVRAVRATAFSSTAAILDTGRMTRKKNPAAVRLGKLRAQKGPDLRKIGRMGGLERARRLAEAGEAPFGKGGQSKGGKVRAAKLGQEQRVEIARKAAEARRGKGGR